MFTRTILLDCQASQLLKLLGIVEPADITDLRQETGYSLYADALDLQQFSAIGICFTSDSISVMIS